MRDTCRTYRWERTSLQNERCHALATSDGYFMGQDVNDFGRSVRGIVGVKQDRLHPRLNLIHFVQIAHSFQRLFAGVPWRDATNQVEVVDCEDVKERHIT